MRYIKILIMALLILVMTVAPTLAAEFTFPQDDGHIWIAEDGSFIDRLPDAIYGEEYEYVIPLQVQVGEGESAQAEAVGQTADGKRVDSQGREYTFALTAYDTLPDGLSMDENGVISGTAVGTTSKTVCLTVHSSDGAVSDAVRYLTLAVDYKAVTVRVSVPTPAPEWTEGGRYKADFAIEEKEGISAEDFTVTYKRMANGEEISGSLTDTYVSESGNYTISVIGKPSLAAKHCVVVQTGDTVLQVGANRDVAVSLDKSEYIVTVGDGYSINVTTRPLGIDYVMTYEGIEGTVYAKTATPPDKSRIGTYLVTVTTRSSNYTSVSATAKLYIKPREVEFTIEGVEKYYNPYNTSPSTVSVQPKSELPEGVSYQVLYNGKAVSTEKPYYPMDAGEYDITIIMSDASYVAKYEPTAMTISPLPLNFYIPVTERKLIYNGNAQKPNVRIPSINGEQVGLTYTIDDLATTDVVEKYTEVTEKGRYKVNIVLSDSWAQNYAVNETNELEFEVVDEPKLVLNDFNSPAAMGATLDESGNYVYGGVVYPVTLWGEDNVDGDKKAWFVRKGNLPRDIAQAGYGMVGSERVSVALAVDGKAWLDWYTTADVGVYEILYETIQYKFNDKNMLLRATRTLVVLPEEEVGDVNGDGYVNVGDARYLQNVVIPNLASMTSDKDKLYLYRVCDVNHDGAVDEKDAATIMNRWNISTVGYYGYLDSEASEAE